MERFEQEVKMEREIEKNITLILNNMKKIVTNPVGFFQSMPKSGGFVEPIIFMVSMGVVAGIIQALLGIVGLFHTSFFGALSFIIIVPVLATIFGFVGAAILFVIWKIMGSQQSFETAYRCGAYAGGIVPITTALSIIPFFGSLLGLIWMTYLLVVASTEVHNIKPKTAWIVFGVICALFALTTIGSEFAARRATNEMSKWGEKMEGLDEMTPEEAGRAMGEFLKGMEKGIDK